MSDGVSANGCAPAAAAAGTATTGMLEAARTLGVGSAPTATSSGGESSREREGAPSAALPSAALPSATLPSAALPSAALPSAALPS
eukprot:5546189-Prymnesium_polylepis.1